MSKRPLILSLIILALFALALTACGSKPNTEPTVAPAATTVAPTQAPTKAPAATEAPKAEASQTPSAAGDPTKGEELFKKSTLAGNPGCITCHALEPGKTLVGPSLAGIATDAAGDAEAEGISTEAMLQEMICDPNAEIAAGFPKDVMPQDWCEKLSPEQLRDIIAFLMTLKEEGGSSASFEQWLDKALDAAKAGNAEAVSDALTEALDLAESEADKAFVQELLDDAKNGKLDEVAEDIETYLSAAGAPTFESLLDKAMDAAKAGDADKAKEELTEALDLAESEADKAFVQELLDDVENGKLDEVAEDIETYLSAAQKESVSEEDAKKAKTVFVKQGCFACHGNNFEGNLGPIIVGMPVEEIKDAVRHGFPEANPPMPAFSPDQLSDSDLDVLARYIHSLTIEDTGLEIPSEVRKHLGLALEAAESGDNTETGKHLQAALDATPAEGYEGLRVTINDLLEDLEEQEEGLDNVVFHLKILLGQS